MNQATLTGKTILILAGRPKEAIDGVRFYANYTRPENQGLHVADALEKLGATIVYITTDTNAADLLESAVAAAKRDPVDAILQLANIPSLKAAHISHTKLKIKQSSGAAVPMEVVGNIDMWAQLRDTFPFTTIVGYDNHQQWLEHGDEAFCKTLRPLIQNASHSFATTLHVAHTAPLPTGPLSGRNIIVTTGPTIETLTTSGDVITNVSSGAQGMAVAQALADMGAHITLISGPTSLPAPHHPRITLLHTYCAHNMLDAVIQSLPADVYIGVAAVADFSVTSPAPLSLSENEPHTLMLAQNPDILATVAHHASRPAFVIGFAAETHDVIPYATAKLEAKGADAICANAVDETTRKRLGPDHNHVSWVTKQGVESWPVMPKLGVGRYIGEKIAALLDAKKA